VLRLIEQPADEGAVLEGEKPLGRVHYHLSIYQHYTEGPHEAVPGYLEVEGRITPIDQLDLRELQGRRVELTLRLADGRRLDFHLGSAEGAIISTGRGLHAES
jgi:hypothetical protein